MLEPRPRGGVFVVGDNQLATLGRSQNGRVDWSGYGMVFNSQSRKMGAIQRVRASRPMRGSVDR